MKNDAISSSDQQLTEQATIWLKAASRDYKAYLNEVRMPWLPLIYINPKEPQIAINHLAQCVEKIVKSIAVASGQYKYEVLRKDFGHDSLNLYLDIMLKLIRTPLVTVFLNTMQGQIFKHSKAELFGPNESLRRLIEIQRKSKLGPSNKEMKEWAFEFATMPTENVKLLANSQLKAFRQVKMVTPFFHMIPVNIFMKIGIKGDETLSSFLKSFEMRGFLLSENVKQFLTSAETMPYLNSVDEERKLLLIKHFGDILLTGLLFSSLLALTSITYAHAISPKYPGNPDDFYDNKRNLNSESYPNLVGLTGSLNIVGKLTSLVLSETRRQLPSFTKIFALFNYSKTFIQE